MAYNTFHDASNAISVHESYNNQREFYYPACNQDYSFLALLLP